MRENLVRITINRSAKEIYEFVITPPNSARWIKSITAEETNSWPIKIGTVYTLQDKGGRQFSVKVTALEENKMVEWTSEDSNYHCIYTFRPVHNNQTDFEYYESVKEGGLSSPFAQSNLETLKQILESSALKVPKS